MPTILILFGLRFFFYSDDHPAIHIHAKKGDGKAKIELEPEIKLVENKGLKAKDLRRAMDIATEYREEFIEEWHKYFG